MTSQNSLFSQTLTCCGTFSGSTETHLAEEKNNKRLREMFSEKNDNKKNVKSQNRNEKLKVI